MIKGFLVQHCKIFFYHKTKIKNLKCIPLFLIETTDNQKSFEIVKSHLLKDVSILDNSMSNETVIEIRFPKLVSANNSNQSHAEVFLIIEQQSTFIGLMSIHNYHHVDDILVEGGIITNVKIIKTYVEEDEKMDFLRSPTRFSNNHINIKTIFETIAKRKGMQRMGKTLNHSTNPLYETLLQGKYEHQITENNTTKNYYPNPYNGISNENASKPESSTETRSTEAQHIPGTPRVVDYTSIWVGFGAWLVIVITAVIFVGYKVLFRIKGH